MITKTIFETELSDSTAAENALTKEEAADLFAFFKNCPLFRWQDANNDCEDRANAICILLDRWNIPNYKAWVFGGAFLKKGVGALVNMWNYHVAASLPVKDTYGIRQYVIDPATLDTIQAIDEWAEGVTDAVYSYYLVKYGDYYIFPPGRIERDNWYKRDRRNYKWTIQGVSGINGVSRVGKAQLCFNKTRIKKTEQKFKQLLLHKPVL